MKYEYAEKLYNLLPLHYRTKDEAEQLRAFLQVLGGTFDILRQNMDELWSDFDIENSNSWVVPYIGELLGTNLIFNDAQRNRVDVKRTIRWRRSKGIIGQLEDMAPSITNWPCSSVEFYTTVGWTQFLNHLKLHLHLLLDVSDMDTLDLLDTGLDRIPHIVDLREPTQNHGWHSIEKVGFFFLSTPVFPMRNSEPFEVASGRYCFNSIGLDQQLFDLQDKSLLTKTELSLDMLKYFGQDRGMTIYEDGIPVCSTQPDPAPPASTFPLYSFGSLNANKGIKAVDNTVVAAGQFQIDAYSMSTELQTTGLGTLITSYTSTGLEGQSGDVFMLKLASVGSVHNFPETEIITRNSRERCILVYLPQLPSLSMDGVYLYVADDGSTYYANSSKSAGAPNLRPDMSDPYGALQKDKYLARKSEGQCFSKEAVYRSLAIWSLANSGEVAIDPVLGRFSFASGEEPQGEVTVDYNYGFTHEVGSGGYERYDTLDLIKSDQVSEVSRLRDAAETIQTAIDGAQVGTFNVVEIRDSATYAESLTIDSSTPLRLTIQSSNSQMPTVYPSGGSLGDAAIHIDTDGTITLNGLFIAQRGISINGKRRLNLRLKHCTIYPGSDDASRPGIFTVYDAGEPIGEIRIQIENCIVHGGIIDDSTNQAIKRVDISNSLVITAFGGGGEPSLFFDDLGEAIKANGAAICMEKSTIIGKCSVDCLSSRDTIHYGDVEVSDRQKGVLRHCTYLRISTGDIPKYEYSTMDVPVFASTTFGSHDYFRLNHNCSELITKGAANGSEMGVFNQALRALREDNFREKLEEYLPIGLREVVVYVT